MQIDFSPLLPLLPGKKKKKKQSSSRVDDDVCSKKRARKRRRKRKKRTSGFSSRTRTFSSFRAFKWVRSLYV